MIDVIDGVLEPSLWFLADWSLRWALLVGVLAVWLAIVRPRRSATRYLLCLLVLVAGLLLPAMPRWGSGFTTGKPHPTVITGDGPADNPQLPASKAHTSDRVSQREPSTSPAPASHMIRQQTRVRHLNSNPPASLWGSEELLLFV